MNSNEKKSLIAFYSRKGNNYVGGSIVNLPVGNTEIAAQEIRELTGGDLFKIETVTSYPEDYMETTEVAQEELRANARPELTGTVENMAEYEIMYLGYPNWWRTMPMAVFTFLEGYDLSGKTIIPFCTHEGSGMGRSERDVNKCCPTAKILSGLAIRGSSVEKANKEVANWLKRHNLL